MFMGEVKGKIVYDFTGKGNEAPDFENVMCSSFVLHESSRRRVILVPTRSHAKADYLCLVLFLKFQSIWEVKEGGPPVALEGLGKGR